MGQNHPGRPEQPTQIRGPRQDPIVLRAAATDKLKPANLPTEIDAIPEAFGNAALRWILCDLRPDLAVAHVQELLDQRDAMRNETPAPDGP